MKNLLKVLSFGLLLFWQMGCTNASTTVSPLGYKLDALEIVAPTDSLVWANSLAIPLVITGKCPKEIVKIEVKGDLVDWVTIQNHSNVTFNCATSGTFSFTINSIASLLSDSGDKKLHIRGFSNAYETYPSIIQVKSYKGNSDFDRELVAGSGQNSVTSGGYKVQSSFHFNSGAVRKTTNSGNYTVDSTVQATILKR